MSVQNLHPALPDYLKDYDRVLYRPHPILRRRLIGHGG